MTRLHAQQFRFRYPAQDRWAVDGVDLDIAPGQITWLTGSLGSGTSTMLLALAGLAPRLTGGERQGRLFLDDQDPEILRPLAAGIAYLGPSPALQLSGITRSVHDEIAVGPMNLGWPRERILTLCVTPWPGCGSITSASAHQGRCPAARRNASSLRHWSRLHPRSGYLTSRFPPSTPMAEFSSPNCSAR